LKKILVIRFSSIGDIVLTSPLLRCIKKQYPKSSLHYLSKEKYSELLENNPYIDKVWTFSEKLAEVIPQLQNENFDYIVDLHRNIRSSVVKTKLKSPSGTFPKLNVQKWLLTNLRLNFLPKIHIVDRYFEAVKKISVRNDNQGLDFFTTQAAELEYASLLSKYSQLPQIALVLGATYHTKRIPESLAVKILDALNRPAILLGGIEEKELAENIVKAVDNQVINACGELGLLASAEAVRQATLVISGDTGFMHIASAYSKPLVSVWGSTVTSFGMYPYYPGNNDLFYVSEIRNLSCRPCSKLGFSRCPKFHFNCMMLQNVDSIVKFSKIYL